MNEKPNFANLNVAALAGGVGGARLAQGLAAILPPERLHIIVNTGDDFEHLGLTICPDLDTVMYTLSGLANPKTGWGIAGDTFTCLEAIQRRGGPGWFNLGDRDLATHILRTQWLHEGQRLTEVTARLATALGVPCALLPMCDTPYQTQVITAAGTLPFQEYFVHQRCRPEVRAFRWEGADVAQPTPEVMAALEQADLVIFCPSNPFVSIAPILNLPGVKEAISRRASVAVSPILGGEAVKGPAAKMFRELGIAPSAVAVAERYAGLLTGFVLDSVDAGLAPAVAALGMATCVMPTLMPGLDERIAVARGVLEFAVAPR
ncbi:MAG: 2-phospho-L-lactate transferase [Anaerolineae bacterium]|nr:2-phospho-L-lactate transferase [Anaerolineae bacterium]